MSEIKEDQNIVSANPKRQTLGLKSSTLTIAPKKTVATEKVLPRSLRSAKSSILVVTKSKVAANHNQSQAAKDLEANQKIALLKQAEWERQASLEKQAILEKQKAEAEQAAAQKREEEAAAEKAKEQKESKEDQIISPALVAAEESEDAPPLAENQQLLVNRSFTLQKNRVRNLDNIAKPVAKIVAEAEPVIEQQKSVSEEVETKPKFKKDVTKHRTQELDANNQAAKADDFYRRSNKRISVAEVMMMDGEEGNSRLRFRSLSSLRRAKDKNRRKHEAPQEREKIIREVLIPDVISVQELASRMSEKASDVIKSLMKLGVMATLNQSVDADTAELIVGEFGHIFKRVTNAEIERSLLNIQIDNSEDLLPRSPVVTIMGHVDHGKTSLLDALRSTDVAAGEAGGITQHIGAYQVTLKNGKHITFLDTPGHEAFTAMRLRGAKVTDIVVLVVAADDGIMEQTIEAISHAKAAQVPIIVAINKMDKPEANPTRVKNELLQHTLVPEDMGGDVIVVEVSARTKANLDRLEEVILLQAEMLELSANPNRSAAGAVIESKIDKGRGPVATLLVQNGTLKVGDIVVAGTSYGSIRALINDKGQHIKEALPATPVEVIGMNTVPIAGDAFVVTANEKTAKDLCQHRAVLLREQTHLASRRGTLEQMLLKVGKDGSKELTMIVKGDVNGSVEAIVNSLSKLHHAEVSPKILHAAVGGITESDVTLASASGALIIGFNVRASNQVKELAKQNNVDIRYYSIIYDLVDDIKTAMTGMLSPIFKENYLGAAEVRQVFDLSKFGKVAGCYVVDGLIRRNAHARLIRNNVVLCDDKIKALKRFKEDLREVKTGFECGISFEKYEDMQVGDSIEVYELTEEARQL